MALGGVATGSMNAMDAASAAVVMSSSGSMDSPAAALKLLSLAHSHLGEGVSAFEIMNRTGFDFLAANLPEVRLPFADAPEWSILIEVGLAAGLDPAPLLPHLHHELQAGFAGGKGFGMRVG